MAKGKKEPADAADSAAKAKTQLRRRAEEIDRENTSQNPELLVALSPKASWQALHELRVHQIELELQNEELRLTQEELLSSRARYFDLFDIAPIGYLTINEKGLIVEANLAFATWVCVERGALLHQPVSRFIFPNDQDSYFLHRKALFDTGESQVCELRLVKKDGAGLWIQLDMNLAQDTGKATLVRATLSDITVRKQLEALIREQSAALSESEARYRTVLEQAPEAVLLIDPETGEVIESNARFAERFGYALGQDGPLTIFNLLFDEPENIRADMNKVLQTGSLPLQRRLFLHRNGSLVTVERSASLLCYQGRRLFVMTVRDVSAEVRHEQEIGRDAQQATRVQNALLSVPEPSDYLDIATVYQPFGYVGGDLYFMDWRYGGNMLRGFLVDATGHGLGTALHTASMHVLIREVNEQDLPLSDAMRWLNQRAGEYFDERTFAGALGFEIDLDIRQLRWVCAGIPRILVSTKTKRCAVDCPGMCLGIRDHETFETHTLPIEIGDCFYFMTDGLTDLLQGVTKLPLDRHSAMLELLQTLSEAQERRDDATAVGIHVRALPQALVRQDGWPRIIRFNGYGDYQRLKSEVTKIMSEVTGLPHSLQEVAVHEALANAMECRDGVPRQHKARLRFNKVGNRLIVRVKTSRISFAGNTILRRLRAHPEEMFSFGEDAAMGRGIPMMLSMSHKMTYNSEGTEVLLAWKLH